MELTPDQLFQHAFEYAAIGMALVDPQGQFLKANRALCRLVGYTEAELLARTFQDITFPDDLELDLGFVQRLLRGEASDYQIEKRYIHRHRHLVWVLLSVSIVREEDGRPRLFVSQIQDITARKHAEFNLAAALAEKAQLLAELQTSAAELQKLQHQMLTVCAWTKRIRYNGEWMNADEFLHKHLQLNLTHGVSEEAAQQIMLGHLHSGSTLDSPA